MDNEVFKIGIIIGLIGLFINIFLITQVFADPVMEHPHLHDLNDPDHWYDTYCCNRRDCAPIPAEAVEATDDGWIVTLNPDDHPMVNEGTGTVTMRAPYKHSNQTQLYAVTRDSRDDHYHACLVREMSGMRMRCFYRPPRGF